MSVQLTLQMRNTNIYIHIYLQFIIIRRFFPCCAIKKKDAGRLAGSGIQLSATADCAVVVNGMPLPATWATFEHRIYIITVCMEE